jgi:hypothetical protein
MAGQPRPAKRVLAFLDPLLGGAATVVELDHPPVGPGQVGDDEADSRPRVGPVGAKRTLNLVIGLGGTSTVI